MELVCCIRSPEANIIDPRIFKKCRNKILTATCDFSNLVFVIVRMGLINYKKDLWQV